MSDNNPQNGQESEKTPVSFLKTAKQGDVWIHRTFGKLQVQGIVRDPKTGEAIEAICLPLQPEPWKCADADLASLARGIEKKHIVAKRFKREPIPFPYRKAS